VIARITLFNFRYAYFLVNVTNNRGLFLSLICLPVILLRFMPKLTILTWFRTVS